MKAKLAVLVGAVTLCFVVAAPASASKPKHHTPAAWSCERQTLHLLDQMAEQAGLHGLEGLAKYVHLSMAEIRQIVAADCASR